MNTLITELTEDELLVLSEAQDDCRFNRDPALFPGAATHGISHEDNNGDSDSCPFKSSGSEDRHARGVHSESPISNSQEATDLVYVSTEEYGAEEDEAAGGVFVLVSQRRVLRPPLLLLPYAS
ncbi:uncharacterized protein TRAVEDRAFT_54291 [Trametes versicolor FP-101664 SS1]|uniref:Uncharacterized protein n=1 Tax=Trametes versicolor (strain FP-101664) TaxID=717944 RepID=R7S837_TRAVS|nr:uncharacterized protein TRAVEDRAFT_54291 [Trametes versicolor FP-101664 SS1]EIW51870.1 hypothetical protein TRAVEDRAFT_54291 [Trametes versicolor FP-101664 SS1]